MLKLKAAVPAALMVLSLSALVPAIVVPSGPAQPSRAAPSQAVLARHSHARWEAELDHAAAVRHTQAVIARRAYLVVLTTPIAVCEEGGWGHYGFPLFPDSLGLDQAAWYGDGGGSDLRPFVQAEVELRFDARYGIGLPDRVGCAGY